VRAGRGDMQSFADENLTRLREKPRPAVPGCKEQDFPAFL
jgi:hypothetical protein